MVRTDLLSLLVFALVFLGLATLVAGPLALAAALVFYLASGLVFTPHRLDLEAERTFSSERVMPGEEVQVTVRITNLGSRLEEVWLEDQVPAGLVVTQGSAGLLGALGHGQTLEVNYSVRGRRGLFRFPGLAAEAHDVLNLVRRRVESLAPRELSVLPQPLRVKRVAIRPQQTRLSTGVIPARQGGPGIDFFGVRQYWTGDSLRHINWKASARRRDTLFSNEFEQERAADVGLILDARRRLDVPSSGTGPGGDALASLFDHQVLATATLTETLLRAGNRVGMLVYGGYLDWTFPGYGKVQQERILRALASARTGDSLAFDQLRNLPARFFPRNSQLVLISSLHPDDLPFLVHLRATGYGLAVISPDPVTFEARQMAGQSVDFSWAEYPFKRSPYFWRRVRAAINRRVEDRLQRQDRPMKADLPRAAAAGLRLAHIERQLLLNRLGEAGIQVFNWDTAQPFDQALQAGFSRAQAWMHIRRVTG